MPRGRVPVGRGGTLVIGLLLLGVGAAITAVAYQRAQTRRCLGFFGADAARLVAAAPAVEIWTLEPGGESGALVAVARKDVSRAAGLVHMRRGLVEDANYAWDAGDPDPGTRLPAGRWDVALAFSDPDHPDRRAVVVVALGPADGPGWLAVVGRSGRVRLGRIAAGLRTWVEAAMRG